MLLPAAFYPHGEAIAKHLPHPRPSQIQGLALWVGGTILAHSGCQNAVLGALTTLGLGWHATRQYLREWLYDGSDRAAPCRVQLDVDACFASLLRWVLAWSSRLLPLATGRRTKTLTTSSMYGEGWVSPRLQNAWQPSCPTPASTMYCPLSKRTSVTTTTLAQ